MTYIKLEEKHYDSMLSCDDKNYVLSKDGELKVHGSGLKGKHLPIVCDELRDALCKAIFQKLDPLTVFGDFQDLSHYPVSAFRIRIYPTKLSYHKNTLYFKLVKFIQSRGLQVVPGTSLDYVKAVDGYKPVALFSSQDRIDYVYYKMRLAEMASRILGIPAKRLLPRFCSQGMDRWTN